MSQPEGSGPSELGRIYADLAVALGPQDQQDLRALLSHHLSAGAPEAERYDQFGLFGRLIEANGYAVPAVDVYDQARAAEPDAGWPSSTALETRFGSWDWAAVWCARWMNAYGRVPNRVPQGPRGPWSRLEARRRLLDARDAARLVRCADLSSWVYADWCAAQRAQRRAGVAVERVPDPPVLRRLFAGWTEALQAADEGR